MYLLFTIAGFCLGSTMFAYWIPKVLKNIDIREIPEDHNPGAANAFTYGGFWVGLLALSMELLKGLLPVALGQRFLDINSMLFLPVLLAPVVGHAFPFFHPQKGGKAIAVSFGVLLGLFPEIRPFAYLAFFYLFFSLVIVVRPHSFRSVITFGLFSLLVLINVKIPAIQIGCLGMSGIVIFKHIIKYQGEALSIHLFTNKALHDRLP